MKHNICYFVGTHNDWGGASRILFNIVRHIDLERFNPLVMLTREGAICDELESRGIEYHVWPKHDFDSPTKFSRGLLGSYMFFKRHRVRLIHFNHTSIGWRPAELLAAKLSGVPALVHCQRIVGAPSPDLKASRLALTSSAYLAQQSHLGGVPHEVVYDIVDVEKFQRGQSLRDKLGLNDSHVVLSFIGRSRRSKGLQMFVDLADRLPGEHLRFLMTRQKVGRKTDDCFTHDEVKAMIAHDRRIIFLDYCKNVEDVYATTDIVVMPSQTAEHCPALPAEAAAAGVPIIATDVGATGEMVVNGSTGYLVGHTNLEAMLGHATSLILDKDLRQRIGRQAILHAQRKFRDEPIARIHSVYERYLASERLQQ